MKGEPDIVAHVASATGVAEQEVRRVIDAAFGYLRASLLAGEPVVHPSLGSIKPRERQVGGRTRTVYRLDPEGTAETANAPKAVRGEGDGAGVSRAGRGSKGKGQGAGKERAGGGRRGGGRSDI